jgi:hypothetical protein
VALIGGGGYPIEFKSVPGFQTPSNRIVLIEINQVATVQADYIGIRPTLSLNRTTGLTLSGDTGARYRVDNATDLNPSITWTPVATQTLANSQVVLSNIQPATAGSRFYRAVLVP